MVTKIVRAGVRWLVETHYDDQYIRKCDISNLLLKVREDEALLQGIKHKKEVDDITRQFQNEKVLLEEELRAEINRLNRVLEGYGLKVKRADSTYFKAKRALRENVQMSEELKSQVRELMNSLGEIFGGIESVELQAIDRLKGLEPPK